MSEGHAFSAIRPQTSLKSKPIGLMMFHRTERGRETSLTGITALSAAFKTQETLGGGTEHLFRSALHVAACSKIMVLILRGGNSLM